jgi:uncharacterized protein YigE (DUF2233 family)
MRWRFLVVLILAMGAGLGVELMRSQAAPRDDGFSVRQVTYAENRYTVVSADLRRVQVKLFWKDTNGKKLGSLEGLQTYLERNKRTFLVGMNAGIFDEGFTPLGLHVERGRTLHALKTRRNGYGNFYLQPNAVFSISSSGAQITETMAFARTNPRVLEATQSGPALVLGGKLHPAFQRGSNNRLARNAVGVVDARNIVLVISNDWVNFDDLARFMRDGLKCTDALYLDGNISKLRVPGSRDDDGEFAGMIGVYR